MHLTIFLNRKQDEGELDKDSGLDKLAKLAEIDVSSSVSSYSCSFLIFYSGRKWSQKLLPGQSGSI
jgi:hypothetical protein